jgi:hypothetical protein
VPIVGGLRVEILGRVMTTDALVLPRGTRPLLGAIQLEFLDLVVVPKTGEVITNPAHPEGATLPLYAVDVGLTSSGRLSGRVVWQGLGAGWGSWNV